MERPRSVRRRERPRERWLLTRKTWRYMADAGRRLVPDGARDRPEDVPRIEAYFQEVCAREPRFLLWRKSSYPGALPRPHRKKRPRGGSVRARSPSDDPPPPPPRRPTDLHIAHTSGGRFDLAKLKRDFLSAPPTPPADAAAELADALHRYLTLEEADTAEAAADAGEQRDACDARALAAALRSYLSRQGERERAAGASGSPDSRQDPLQRSLLDTLGRYYSRSPNRDHVLQDLLTDRKLLKKLYNDLRRTQGYGVRGGRVGGSGGGSGGGGSGGATDRTSGSYCAGGSYGSAGPSGSSTAWHSALRPRRTLDEAGGSTREEDRAPASPPPLIEVRGDSEEERSGVERGTQTVPVPDAVLAELAREYRERCEAASSPTSPTSPTRGPRRRSSVDHDDVSQSVSDTIKRYLRMARKKSVDADKADRFKRINYDKNLRNIKSKGYASGEGESEGPHKGCQTEEAWMLGYRELRLEEASSSVPESPGSPQSPSFLATLLGRGATANVSADGGTMHKSRSSGSVVQSVSKRIWRARSRSTSRAATAAWTPQENCEWTDTSGRTVRLTEGSLLALSEVERRALQQAALARLQQLNLGCPLKVPEEITSATTSKPKRRAYLLKRKALTTGFFDQNRTKDGEKEKEGGGLVFGVPLGQCVESERALRRQQQHGSRASLASLTLDRADDSESCSSGGSLGGSVPGRLQWAGLEEAVSGGPPRVPALVAAALRHLRAHGLATLGLFRVSTSKKRVRQLREEWDRGVESALDSALCPHDVATLLKEFLRDLPDPLLCRDLYQAFLSTQKIRNRRLQWEGVRLLVQLLPAAHRDTLHELLAFLAQVADHAEDRVDATGKTVPGNKMDSTNLATVFAPNILHCIKAGSATKEISAEQLGERADVINVVRLLIERQTELWALPADLLHEAYIQLAHRAPQHLDRLLQRRAAATQAVNDRVGGAEAEGGTEGGTEGGAEGERRVWSREECLHGGAATGGPDLDVRVRQREKTREPSSRRRESSTSGGARVRSREDAPAALQSGMTIVARLRGQTGEESGVRSGSTDSASDFNETSGGASDESCVITASLRIPGALLRDERERDEHERAQPAHHAAPVPAPRRRQRSSSGSDSSLGSQPVTGTLSLGPAPLAYDSAVGSSALSSPPSWASSPPASPLRVTITSAGEIHHQRVASTSADLAKSHSATSVKSVAFASKETERRYVAAVAAADGGALLRSKTADFERILHLSKEKHTSDARAVALSSAPADRKRYSKRRYTDSRHQTKHIPDAEALEAAEAAVDSATVVYKRGQLISSVQTEQK